MSNPPRLQELFAEVAPTYERVNHVLTLGMDRRWRRKAARITAAGGGTLWLDACSGTGDMAEALGRRAEEGTKVIALDFCAPMFDRVRTKKGFGTTIEAVLADVKRLPFPEATFDAVTISFATRNINISREALTSTFAELRRVLKPGGRFVNVETSQPRAWLVRAAFRAYVGLFVRRVGERISGSRPGYAYLSSTIPRFYGPEELAGILREAGFAEVSWQRLLFGAAAVHLSVKR
jgi:demethylmenaquinone methyltransferase/2-methoxy-6-polyprenyl-1,4-benzoquinol methylase